jgi:hypothetical protein
MNTNARFRTYLVGFSLVSAWGVPAAMAEPTPPHRAEPMLEIRDGLISLEPHDAPLGRILALIEARGGVRIHALADLDRPVRASFRNRPFDQAISELFGSRAGRVVRHAGSEARAGSEGSPAEVWILEEPESIGGSFAGSRSPAPLVAAPTAEATELPLEELQRQLADEDPSLRYQALGQIAEGAAGDDDAIRTTLQSALADKDPNVRGLAIQMLAQRDEPAALDVLSAGLRDESVNVRAIAVASIDPQRHGLPLLHEALQDTEESIRIAAAERIASVGK